MRASAVLVAVALMACADPAAPPPVETERLGAPLGYEGGVVDLTWVPGSRRVVFRAPAAGGAPCGVRSVDVDDGTVAFLDADCNSLSGFTTAPLRGLATSADGAVVTWQVGVTGADPAGGAVRVSVAAAPPVELRRTSRLWPAVAVSPDGRRVAWSWSLADSMAVRDLQTGGEVRIDFALPIAFSPDGRSLAYLVGPGAVRRRVVGTVAEEVVALGLNAGDALGPVTWAADGIWAVLDRLGGGIRLRHADSGSEVVATSFDFGKQVRFPTWSRDGTRIAFWEQYCALADPGAPCTVEQARLVVFERATGNRIIVAWGQRAGGPITFAPGGDELVYAFGGALYRSAVREE